MSSSPSAQSAGVASAMHSLGVAAPVLATAATGLAALYFFWYRERQPPSSESAAAALAAARGEAAGISVGNMPRSSSMLQEVVEDSADSKFAARHRRRNMASNRQKFELKNRIARLEDVHLLDVKTVLGFDRVGESPEFRIPHLSSWCSPFWYTTPCPFKPVGNTECVVADVILDVTQSTPPRFFLRGGPRSEIFFHPLEVRACIVTCGGICPGINTVVREIVMSLRHVYGVREIFGIQYGYEGFYKWPVVQLNPELISDIHVEGGTVLGTSRGGFDLEKICDAIETHRFNQVYAIGGDGTHRGLLKLHEELQRRQLKVSVVGLCKTIDNDIPLLDRSFGFDTAVEEALLAVKAAHVEIRSCLNGVGLVIVMGRSAGFIAMQTALASRDVNVCLIPEVKFDLEGEHGLLSYIQHRLTARGHCLILCAEGAGVDLMPSTGEKDASGNPKLPDIGSFLKGKIKEHLAKSKFDVQLKMIDPSYIVRACPPVSSDSVYCTILGQTAVHGAMAGFTGFSVGLCNNHHVLLPISKVTQTRHVDPADRMWHRVLISTGQPDFTLRGASSEMLPTGDDSTSGPISPTTMRRSVHQPKDSAASLQ